MGLCLCCCKTEEEKINLTEQKDYLVKESRCYKCKEIIKIDETKINNYHRNCYLTFCESK